MQATIVRSSSVEAEGEGRKREVNPLGKMKMWFRKYCGFVRKQVTNC